MLEKKPVVTVDDPPTNFLGMNQDDTSTLSKLSNIAVICLKFIKRRVWDKLSRETRVSKPGLQSLFTKISDENTLTASDYSATKLQWVKCVQHNHFADIIETLRSERPTKQLPQIAIQLGLQLDSDGLIRSHGRFEHADLPDETKQPLLLPKADRFTTLVVEDVHRQAMHSGVGCIPHAQPSTPGILDSTRTCSGATNRSTMSALPQIQNSNSV